MTKSKYHHYVLVLGSTGAAFVTAIYPKHTAEWCKTDKPLEFTKDMAEDVALGLTLNFNIAYHITVPYEIEAQPYHYDKGDFKWVEKTES